MVPRGRLARGATLVWAFRPVRRRYLYRLPAIARLVVVEPEREVTWEVTALPGFHARHTYSFADLGEGRSRFGSWEQASGPLYRWLHRFWTAHFRFVCEESIAGAADAVRRGEGAARLVRHGSAQGGVPLVVVPGMDGSVGTLAPVVERLARSRPVIVVDYTTERNASLEAFSREVAELVRAQVPGEVDVLAASLGSLAVAQAIGDHGLAARRVVLVGTFTRVADTRLRVNNLLVAVSPRRVYQALAPLLMGWVCGPVGDGRHHAFFRHVRRSDPSQVVKRTRWEIGRDFAPELAKITAPTLVLMGARDRFVPDIDEQLDVLRGLVARPGSEVRSIADAGHVLLPRAAVDAAVAAAEAFLDREP